MLRLSRHHQEDSAQVLDLKLDVVYCCIQIMDLYLICTVDMELNMELDFGPNLDLDVLLNLEMVLGVYCWHCTHVGAMLELAVGS